LPGVVTVMQQVTTDRTIKDLSLKTIMDSGQCFRLRQLCENKYDVVAWGKYLVMEQLGGQTYRFYCSEHEFEAVWSSYFDVCTDYCEYCACVTQSDGYMNAAIEHGAGMKILRQEPWEMLVTFIISQRKNIPAIQTSVALLCKKYGERISDEVFAFPAPETLAALTEQDLAACALGYRAKYVLDAGRRVACGKLNLQALFTAPDDKLKAALLETYGVGEKVAHCVMLFGYHRLSAFPVDIWIERIVEKEYRGVFPLRAYGQYAGVLQQYIFLYERFRAGKVKTTQKAAII